jgi:hypothetical protein
MLLVSFTMRQYHDVLRIVTSEDKNAFVTIHRAHEISGEGWTWHKVKPADASELSEGSMQNEEKSERNLCFAIDFCAKFLYNEKNMVGGAATWEN